MKNKKIYLVLLLGIIILITGCSGQQPDEVNDETEEVTDENQDLIVVKDALGREVEIPTDADEFVNVGVGSLRLYSYIAPMDKIVGVEENEKSESSGVPYSILNHDFIKDLPVVGQGGPGSSLNPEQIIEVNPDVVFSTYTTDISEINDFQEQIGIPVVALSYGESEDIFDEELIYSLELIGEITKEEQRAKELIGTLEEYKKDLNERTKDIPEDEKPSVYVGALGHKGPQGIESTRGNYSLLNVLNSNNIVDQSDADGSVMLDKEQILEWDPDYIFIDMDGYHIVKEDFQEKPEFYESLTAVKEERVYSQLPYILLRTNFETAIADAYYVGSVLYPEAFEDIDPEKKADEIYENFLGEPFYEKMAEDYRPFGPLKIGE